MRRSSLLLAAAAGGLLVAAGCRHVASEPDDGVAAPVPAEREGGATIAARDAAFDATVAIIAARRLELADAYRVARTDQARAAIRVEARRFLLGAIRDDLFPLWLGTPWGLGKNSTATRPHQPDMTVGCSYFVTSILQNADFHLDNRYRFAQAPALDIQRSLARRDGQVRRFLSLPARDLERRVASLPDGLWLIGLSNHVGWVLIEAGEVRFVHASWTGDRQVSDEAFVTAEAIAVSRKAGYFVSPVIVDGDENDGLIDAWLRGSIVRFRG